MYINLTVQSKTGSFPLDFPYEKMVNAGFSGRNQEEVQKHVQELAAKGISAPKDTPTLYPVVCHSLLKENSIDVLGEATSGEVEYVLLVLKDEIYVGLGSDHTDRHLEETDIPRAKQICPNLISATIWPYSEIKEHWDELVLKSHATQHGKTTPYQEGKLASILSPEQMLDFVRSKVNCSLENMVIYSGTVGMLNKDFIYADRFQAELQDPILGRSIELEYSIYTMDYMNMK